MSFVDYLYLGLPLSSRGASAARVRSSISASRANAKSPVVATKTPNGGQRRSRSVSKVGIKLGAYKRIGKCKTFCTGLLEVLLVFKCSFDYSDLGASERMHKVR